NHTACRVSSSAICHFDVCATGITTGLAFADVVVTRAAGGATTRCGVIEIPTGKIGGHGRAATQQQCSPQRGGGDATARCRRRRSMRVAALSDSRPCEKLVHISPLQVVKAVIAMYRDYR